MTDNPSITRLKAYQHFFAIFFTLSWIMVRSVLIAQMFKFEVFGHFIFTSSWEYLKWQNNSQIALKIYPDSIHWRDRNHVESLFNFYQFINSYTRYCLYDPFVTLEMWGILQNVQRKVLVFWLTFQLQYALKDFTKTDRRFFSCWDLVWV